MKRLRTGLVLGLAAAGIALQTLAPSLLGCTACAAAGQDAGAFLWGLAMLAGLVCGLAWLEAAPLREVAVHLAGLAATVPLVWAAAAWLVS